MMKSRENLANRRAVFRPAGTGREMLRKIAAQRARFTGAAG